MANSGSTAFSTVLVLCLAVSAPAQDLEKLIQTQDHTIGRLSSSDIGGGNWDMRRIEPCATLKLGEIENPGIITLWFTTLYPSRSSLRKLVLRIYFDDQESMVRSNGHNHFFFVPAPSPSAPVCSLRQATCPTPTPPRPPAGRYPSAAR